MPTLQSLVRPKKETKEKNDKSDKKKTIKNNDNVKEKKDETTIEMIETKMKNEEAKKKNFEKESKVKGKDLTLTSSSLNCNPLILKKILKKNLKQKLIEENELEEKEIRKLEKLLHIKKGVKKIKKSFYDEGMGDLLEFCDDEKRQEILKNGSGMNFDKYKI